jgi:hypothetical protein
VRFYFCEFRGNEFFNSHRRFRSPRIGPIFGQGSKRVMAIFQHPSVSAIDFATVMLPTCITAIESPIKGSRLRMDWRRCSSVLSQLELTTIPTGYKACLWRRIDSSTRATSRRTSGSTYGKSSTGSMPTCQHRPRVSPRAGQSFGSNRARRRVFGTSGNWSICCNDTSITWKSTSADV